MGEITGKRGFSFNLILQWDFRCNVTALRAGFVLKNSFLYIILSASVVVVGVFFCHLGC